jgi:hypothetical protein
MDNQQDRNLVTEQERNAPASTGSGIDQNQQVNENQRANEKQQYERQPTQGGQGQRQEFQPVGQPRQQTQTMEQGTSLNGGGLMGGQQMERYATQWNSIQAAFVDEPRKAVEQADQLVAQIIQDLTKTFANERQNLEGQWSRGDQVSTEDLRVALQRYRQFFQSLLRT